MNHFIPLHYWWLGVLSYGACHGAHISAWRRRPVSHHLLGLMLVLVVVPGVVVLGLGFAFGADSSWIAPCVVHLLLAGNYIAVYPAIQATSPTLQILVLLDSHPAGLSEEAILESVATNSVMADRVGDLLRAKLVRRSVPGGSLTLSWRGNLLAEFFAGYRQIIGLARGAG